MLWSKKTTRRKKVLLIVTINKTGPQKKMYAVVIWGNTNFLYKVDMLITNMSAISLHHVKISFYERSKYLPFSSKSLGSRVYKIYYRWNYVRNIDCEALKIGKMPPKRVISASLGYERSSRSLYLLTFGGGMYQSGMNLKGLRSQIPINLRFMGNQPFIDHACWKKHMKKDSLLRTQFLNDSNEIRTQNYLVRKRILNHLAKRAK